MKAIKSLYKRFLKLVNGQYSLAFIVYKLFSKGNCIPENYPYKLYRLLLGNKFDIIGDFCRLKIETYDGLNQTVHPSVTLYDNKFILAITPFPYGNDYYENPCLYQSEDGISYVPISNCQPIAYPNKCENLIYLSDPVVFREDDGLHLIYRECRYTDKSNYITNYYEVCSNNLKEWSEPLLIYSSQRGAMSPSFISISEVPYLYYVLFDENNSTGLYRKEKKSVNSKEEKLIVNGIPEGYMLWHIDICYWRNHYYGLFTLSLDYSGRGACLFLSESDDAIEWNIIKEIVVDQSRKKITKTYKACFVIKKNDVCDIYVSLRRIDRIWSTYKIENINLQKEISK